MARFFNPVIGLSDSSTGAGKTFLLRRIRVRTIADTLDCLYRFGGEFFFPGLVEMNLNVANMPIICVSNPQVSGLVVEDEDSSEINPARAGHLDDLESFVASLDRNIRVLGRLESDEPEVLNSIISNVTNGAFVTTWRDGIRRNVSEVADSLFDGVTNRTIWAAYRMNGRNVFFFAITPFDMASEFPGSDPSVKAETFARIHCVMREPTVTFNGTGVPRHVTLEGLNFPVVGGSVIDRSVDSNKWSAMAYQYARYISDADADIIDDIVRTGKSERNGSSDQSATNDNGSSGANHNELLANVAKGVSGSTFTAAHLGYMAICYPGFASELCSLPTSAFAWSDVIDNDQVLASAADARALYWGIRGSNTLSGFLLSGAGTVPRITDNEVSIVTANVHRHHYFDLFKEWIVDPVGDIFIETLGQVWNRIADTETALKTGMSSGITRAFDAATGNAVWALYVNRGDPDNDPVMMRYITGLESGITVYHDDGRHLSPYVSGSHRTTNRAVSHAVIRGIDDALTNGKILIFFDTPQPNKIRRAYIFRTDYSVKAALVTNFLGSVLADQILNVVNLPDADFFGTEVVPEQHETLNMEAIVAWLTKQDNQEATNE